MPHKNIPSVIAKIYTDCKPPCNDCKQKQDELAAQEREERQQIVNAINESATSVILFSDDDQYDSDYLPSQQLPSTGVIRRRRFRQPTLTYRASSSSSSSSSP